MNVMDEVFFPNARSLFFKYTRMAKKKENEWMNEYLKELNTPGCSRERAIKLFGEIYNKLGTQEVIKLKKRGRAPLNCFEPEERAKIVKERDIRRAERLRTRAELLKAKEAEAAKMAEISDDISDFQASFERHLKAIEKKQERTESLPLKDKKRGLTGLNYRFYQTEEGQEVVAVIQMLWEDGHGNEEIARQLQAAGYVQKDGSRYGYGTVQYVLNRYILNSNS